MPTPPTATGGGERDRPRVVVCCRGFGEPIAIRWERSVRILARRAEWD